MAWLPTGHGTDVYVESGESTDKYFAKQRCPHCDRKFSTQSGMIKHVDEYHKKEHK